MALEITVREGFYGMEALICIVHSWTTNAVLMAGDKTAIKKPKD